MQSPITTHYKDEDIVNQQIENEISNKNSDVNNNTTTPPQQPTKLNVLPINNENGGATEKRKIIQSSNANNIVNAFRQKMANHTTPIELPSIGKTIEFKEISTAEQKEMSKVAMQNNSRSDIMYVAMLNLINKLSTDKSFNIRDYTEFERILITLNLQQMNKVNPEIKYTCSKCGRENVYNLDTNTMLREFSKTYKADSQIEVESGNRKFSFVVGWAKVGSVEDFFKHYYKKYDNSGKAIKETIDNMSQIEYITMFIKSITVSDLSNPDEKITADLESLPYGDRIQIIDCIPQNIFFDDSTGIVSSVIKEYVEPMNKVFKYKDCAYCGAEQEGQVANLSDFLGG